MPDRQPKLYNPIPSQLGALCQKQGCHSQKSEESESLGGGGFWNIFFLKVEKPYALALKDCTVLPTGLIAIIVFFGFVKFPLAFQKCLRQKLSALTAFLFNATFCPQPLPSTSSHCHRKAANCVLTLAAPTRQNGNRSFISNEHWETSTDSEGGVMAPREIPAPLGAREVKHKKKKCNCWIPAYKYQMVSLLCCQI